MPGAALGGAGDTGADGLGSHGSSYLAGWCWGFTTDGLGSHGSSYLARWCWGFTTCRIVVAELY